MTANHTPTDALTYLAARVIITLEWATDAIGGNILWDNDTIDDLYARNEIPLDALSDLAKEIRQFITSHTDGTHYSDGRPVRTTIELPGHNTQFVHLWPADPTTATEHCIEVAGHGSRSVVHVLPPSTLRVETVRTLAVIREFEEDES
ncbi:hypothetical protein CEJ39_17185 [Rhodococcus pyridinivorans]|uniref:hypothetical protein n=1 Tax=Rhodococcus pyridinivorans TaxID=103816 RepID=UPI0003028936|nr:hypothetical protein [Rhodococcus pyridinivorans]AWZ25668.1 hypothetical protein CEJ39_17185 [Rhodococcus pyridinivorans]